MVTLLLSSVLFLAVLAIAIYFWQKPANTSQSIELPPPPEPRGLFSDFTVNQLRTPTESKPPEVARKVDEQLFQRSDRRDPRVPKFSRQTLDHKAAARCRPFR